MSERGAWLGEVKGAVDARLARFFETETARTANLAPEGVEITTALAELTIRGGKRLRPAALVAAFRAVAPTRDWRDTIDCCAALELLQTYLLVHDDWMDGDVQRRGGPSVHAALGERYGDAHLGASLAILAGDLGSAYAQQLVVEGAARAPDPLAVQAAFVRMQVEVVIGQVLDLRATEDVSRMQRLKTGSYTVDGPLRLGALLAGASAMQLGELEAFATPIGEAFQVRDDLLGTFGDPRRTGKPAGNDLRAGKRTALVRECERLTAPAEREALTRVLGHRDATDDAIGAAMDLLVRCGARTNVETRLAALHEQALASLAAGTLAEPGRAMLGEIADALAARDR